METPGPLKMVVNFQEAWLTTTLQSERRAGQFKGITVRSGRGTRCARIPSRGRNATWFALARLCSSDWHCLASAMMKSTVPLCSKSLKTTQIVCVDDFHDASWIARRAS